jgi:glutathione S-transferase
MKLYYSPAACSLSPHILAHEAGITLDLVKVDLATKKTQSGDDFNAIVRKGYVPALQLDNGEIITEGVAIDLYLSNLKPEKKLMPAQASADFLKFLEVMVFISTELHKGIGGLFAPLPDEAKDMIRKKLRARLSFVAQELKGKEYLFNNQFSAADAYLFTVLNWAPMVKLDLSEWKELGEFQERLAKRPSVQAALKSEGLLDKKAA